MPPWSGPLCISPNYTCRKLVKEGKATGTNVSTVLKKMTKNTSKKALKVPEQS